MPVFRITAIANDPHDGVTRLLGDVARFGYSLKSVELKVTEDQGEIVMHIAAQASTSDVISARFARHPSIACLTACCESSDTTATHHI